MKKDCTCCVQWSQAEECCTAYELLEYDPDEFDKVCPKFNGDPEFQDDRDY